jgi:hypothetical protein
MNNNNIISSFDIFSTQSNELCLIDPMIFCLIITIICLLLYIIGFRLSNNDIK